jgi:hypothetical protein
VTNPQFTTTDRTTAPRSRKPRLLPALMDLAGGDSSNWMLPAAAVVAAAGLYGLVRYFKRKSRSKKNAGSPQAARTYAARPRRCRSAHARGLRSCAERVRLLSCSGQTERAHAIRASSGALIPCSPTRTATGIPRWRLAHCVADSSVPQGARALWPSDFSSSRGCAGRSARGWAAPACARSIEADGDGRGRSVARRRRGVCRAER